MIEVKGKFITLTGRLMSIYKNAIEFCDRRLFEKTGLHYEELEPEGWYDVCIFNGFMVNYAKVSRSGEDALITLGKQVYPTVEKTAGLPEHIKTPLDLILYEAVNFRNDHRGPDIKPRIFKKQEAGYVIVSAEAPGYSQKLYEGVYLGILEMFGVKGDVRMITEHPFFEYEIIWKP